MPLTNPPSALAPYSAAWDLLTFSLWVADRKGEVLWVNTATEMLVGRSRRAIVGEGFVNYFPESAPWFDEKIASQDTTGQMAGSLGFTALVPQGNRQSSARFFSFSSQ